MSEEDIEILEKYANFNEVASTRRLQQAVQNMLKENEANKKRIKELEEEINNSYNTVVKLTRENTKLKYDLFRSISKEKVREIAEQYEDKAKRIAGTYQYAESREDLENKKRIVIELRTKAEALQELLKDGGE